MFGPNDRLRAAVTPSPRSIGSNGFPSSEELAITLRLSTVRLDPAVSAPTQSDYHRGQAPRRSTQAQESADFSAGCHSQQATSLELSPVRTLLAPIDTATFVTVSAAAVFRLANLRCAAIMRPRADFSTE